MRAPAATLAVSQTAALGRHWPLLRAVPRYPCGGMGGLALRIVVLAALLLPVEGGAARRQTINFNVPGGADYVSSLRTIAQAVNGSETSAIGPAAHILFNVVGTPDAILVNQTRGWLEAAVVTRVPVFFGWDSQIFWGHQDLWNHFNSSAPGYDPKNKANVEWTRSASHLAYTPSEFPFSPACSH